MTLEDCIGKICPYCKGKLEDTDNIVACSACEMPHHKECWIENRGCTTFGCMGTINQISQNELVVDITLEGEQTQGEKEGEICPRCKNTLTAEMRFCSHCGAPRNQAPAQPATYCGGCGNPLPADVKFCPRCGRPRNGGAPQPARPMYPPQPPVVYGRPMYAPPVYTPPAPQPAYAPVFCNRCGQRHNPGTVFCNRCGQRLTQLR